MKKEEQDIYNFLQELHDYFDNKLLEGRITKEEEKYIKEVSKFQKILRNKKPEK